MPDKVIRWVAVKFKSQKNNQSNTGLTNNINKY